MRHFEITYVFSTTTGLFEQTRSGYGEIHFRLGDRTSVSRRTTAEGVLDEIYALAELDRASPHARIINLETSVTSSNTYWRGKGIHYRMHPRNVPCLTAARVDVCALANNHVLEYGYAGLEEAPA